MSILNLLKPTATSKKSPAIRTDTGIAEAIAFIEAKRQLDAADANAEVLKSAVYDLARGVYLTANAGRPVPDDAVEFPTPIGTVRASFSAAWKASPACIAALPSGLVRERFTIQIDGDGMSEAQATAFVPALLALAAQHGVKVESKGALYPVPDFNVRRFTVLTPEQNLAAEAAGLGTKITLRVSK